MGESKLETSWLSGRFRGSIDDLLIFCHGKSDTLSFLSAAKLLRCALVAANIEAHGNLQAQSGHLERCTDRWN